MRQGIQLTLFTKHLLEDPVEVMSGVCGGLLLALGRGVGVDPSPPPRRRQELKHGRGVLRQHLSHLHRHRVRPEEVVIESVIGV